MSMLELDPLVFMAQPFRGEDYGPINMVTGSNHLNNPRTANSYRLVYEKNTSPDFTLKIDEPVIKPHFSLTIR